MNEGHIIELETNKALNLYQVHSAPLSNEIKLRLLEIDKVCLKKAVSQRTQLISKLFILKVIQQYAKHFDNSEQDRQSTENFRLLDQLYQQIECYQKKHPVKLTNILLFISEIPECFENIDVDCFYHQTEKLVNYFTKLDEARKTAIQTTYSELQRLFKQYSEFLNKYFKNLSIEFTYAFESEVDLFDSYEQLNAKKTKIFLFNALLSKINTIQSKNQKPGLSFFQNRNLK